MANAVRIGLVGIGDIGRIHGRALAQIPDVELVVTQGRAPHRAVDFARELGVETAGSFEVLLNDPSVQGVSICVPNDLHARYAVAALQAGKAVLCEKPLALSMADGELIAHAAETCNRPLMVGHVLRFWPEYAEARRLLQSNHIGKTQVFTARRLVPLLRAVKGEDGWRHAGSRTGGAVVDLQIHDLDFVIWTFGMPRTVTSRGVRTHTGAFDHVFTLLTFEDGLVVEIESSFMLQGNPVTMDFRAIGEDGSLEFAFVEGNFAMHDIQGDGTAETREGRPSLLLYRWGNQREVLYHQGEDPIGAIFDAELRAFVALVRGDRCIEAPTPRQSLDALRVALASQESCATGKTITLD